MSSLISAISGFISIAMTLAVAGSILALVAGEVRLAALKKTSEGLSKPTQKMTKTQFRY